MCTASFPHLCYTLMQDLARAFSSLSGMLYARHHFCTHILDLQANAHRVSKHVSLGC